MPPPKPTTEPGPRPRQRREMKQLERALAALGPSSREELEKTVGGAYWDPGRFDKALTAAVAGGRVVIDADGRYTAV